MPSSRQTGCSREIAVFIAVPSLVSVFSIPPLVRNELARRLLDLLLARQKFFLQRRRIGHRGIERSDDSDRCVEKFESFFLNDGRDGLTDGAAACVFVNDH